MMKKRYIIGLIGIILAFIIAAYFIEKSFSFNLVRLENYIGSFGPWVPILLFFIIIITSSIGFIFMIPVALTALLLNGYVAFFISLLGLTIGAAISFFAARYFGRDYFERKFRAKVIKLEKLEEGLSHKDFIRIIFLRLIIFVPYEIINIGAGLSRMKFLPFILATLIGITPGTIITIYLIKSTQNVFSTQFLIASIIQIGFAFLPLLSKKVRGIILNSE